MATEKIISIAPLGFPWATQDPFLFCVHHLDEYPEGNDDLGPAASLTGRSIGQDFAIKDGWRMYHGRTIPGFPYHPHRGFETITINKQGFVDHFDSLGATGRFGAGDVQWMTAGKGVQHSEMFPLVHQDQGNTLEIFQIWLNLPKAGKFVEPHFKMLWAEDIPEVVETDNNGNKTTINVVAGNLNGTQAPHPTPDSWAANLENEVAVLTIKMDANAQWTLPAGSEGLSRTIYFYRGNTVSIEGKDISNYQSIRVFSDEEISITAGSEDVYILILQGKPINEPVAQHGPFVMNTQQEIQEAFDEYRRTEFGGWPWDGTEMAHARNIGRFAKYPDGKEEVKA